jgi:hypothetical protein
MLSNKRKIEKKKRKMARDAKKPKQSYKEKSRIRADRLAKQREDFRRGFTLSINNGLCGYHKTSLIFYHWIHKGQERELIFCLKYFCFECPNHGYCCLFSKESIVKASRICKYFLVDGETETFVRYENPSSGIDNVPFTGGGEHGAMRK